VQDSIENYVKNIQAHFSRREYEQFIKPLIMSFEQQEEKRVKRNVSDKIHNLKVNVVDGMLHKVESFNGKNFIAFDEVVGLIEQEVNNLNV
jgi:hypothetical protein